MTVYCASNQLPGEGSPRVLGLRLAGRRGQVITSVNMHADILKSRYRRQNDDYHNIPMVI